MGDRFDLQRIGDHHALHEKRQHPRHGHAVAGRLNRHLVRRQKALAEALQRRARHVDPACMPAAGRLPR